MGLIQIIFSKLQTYRSLPQFFDLGFRFLLVILPFHVIMTVFFQEKIGIHNFTFYKELILLGLGIILCIQIFRKKIVLRFERIDWLLMAYFAWMILVTLFHPEPIAHLLYGGRYDFEFFLAFLLIRHGISMLSLRPMQYLRMFIISASAALAIGILVRWVFGETILLHFGFSGNLSNWMFGGSIPIYHGIDQANVRRFQGIFDGPNPAGFFIILYFGVMATYFQSAKKYHFLLGLWGIILVGVLIYTYSRSALLGFAAGMGVVILYFLPTIWKKHKSIMFWSIPFLMLFLGMFFLKFEATLTKIVMREGSTKGHFERAVTGIERAKMKPLGSGLASAGPAYRFVHQPEPNESLFEGENKTEEDYYIPESWFIQQLVEGGLIGFALFLAIMGTLALQLLKKNIFLFGSFIGMNMMNLVLHSYESSYISLLLFMMLALILYYDSSRVRQR
ncbi:MAG: O-antigen ligase family protein [Candidatus Gracilibacteria bacterium]|nr:O-antigen ligase family protein [Candidatus Gracilibacteria bacterium]